MARFEQPERPGDGLPPEPDIFAPAPSAAEPAWFEAGAIGEPIMASNAPQGGDPLPWPAETAPQAAPQPPVPVWPVEPTAPAAARFEAEAIEPPTPMAAPTSWSEPVFEPQTPFTQAATHSIADELAAAASPAAFEDVAIPDAFMPGAWEHAAPAAWEPEVPAAWEPEAPAAWAPDVPAAWEPQAPTRASSEISTFEPIASAPAAPATPPPALSPSPSAPQEPAMAVAPPFIDPLPPLPADDLSTLAARFEAGLARRAAVSSAEQAARALEARIGMADQDDAVRQALRALRPVAVRTDPSPLPQPLSSAGPESAPSLDQEVDMALEQALGTLRKLSELGRR